MIRDIMIRINPKRVDPIEYSTNEPAGNCCRYPLPDIHTYKIFQYLMLS
jgi:hypothetical protein